MPTQELAIIDSNERIAETLYSLGTWFVSGIYVQIPCIKEIMIMIIIIIIADFHFASRVHDLRPLAAVHRHARLRPFSGGMLY